MKTPLFDICIVGGGINGCGIARDAAGRGLNVALCELTRPYYAKRTESGWQITLDNQAKIKSIQAKVLINAVNDYDDLGEHFGHGLYELEVRYLIEKEWASNAEDILWRRTKLGMLFEADEVNYLTNWIDKFQSES